MRGAGRIVHTEAGLTKAKRASPEFYQSARPSDISAGPDGRTMQFDQDQEFWAEGVRKIFDGELSQPLRLGRRFFVLREMGVRDKGISLFPDVAKQVRKIHPDIPEEV